MTTSVAFSPCPNDTFLLYGWVHRKIASPLHPSFHLADIEQLNEWAIATRYPVCKVSCACLDRLVDRYVVLPVGAALGWSCGPKLIARRHYSLDDLPDLTVAVPGQNTTAHRLMEQLLPSPKSKIWCTYDESEALVDQGEVDCALIIHEQRFTFQKAGFYEIADLGVVWENRYHIPVPLGCVVADRNHTDLAVLITTLRESLQYGWDNPEQTTQYVLSHSINKDPTVVQQHIDTYVTNETLSLTTCGQQAIEQLIPQLRGTPWLAS